jgi:hypothetical protein
MKFWRKGPVDAGEKVTKRAAELRRLAAVGMTDPTHTVTALGNALGTEVGAMFVQYPGLIMEETLEMVFEGAREHAYLTAGLPLGNEDAKELAEEDFKDLTSRIITTATRKTQPNDAIAAITKALGVLIAFTARRPGAECSAEELLAFCQKAVAECTLDALAAISNNNAQNEMTP